MVAELPPESRYELHKGALLDISPAPLRKHQQVLVKLLVLFHRFLEANPIGEVFIAPLDVVLSETDVVEPDLIVLLGDTGDPEETHIRQVPDLVLEVLSPGSVTRDLVEKRALYTQYGVKEYWIVDPLQTSIEVHTLEGNTYSLHASAKGEGLVESALLPGLVVGLEEVF
jgi:Uma2 family endonuclease